MTKCNTKLAADYGAWDRECARRLRDAGLNQEQIGMVIGEIAEHRQHADRQGFTRGFKNGFNCAMDKLTRPSPPTQEK